MKYSQHPKFDTNQNLSELSPWLGYQTQQLSSSHFRKDKSLIQNGEQQQEYQNKNKSFELPRVQKHWQRTTTRIQKQQLQMSKKNLIVDKKSQRSFDVIKRAKQTSFNGFMTKYKTQNKNKRYLLASKQAFFKADMGNTMKLINFNKIIPENEMCSQEQTDYKQYTSRQNELCRKRSLAHLIKSLGKEKLYQIKTPRKFSPWVVSSSLSPVSISKANNIEQLSEEKKKKLKRNMKLMELNLCIREKNLQKKN